MDSAKRFTVPFIIDGQDFISDQTFDVTSPETGKSVWSSCAATVSDAINAVESCQNAFSSWSQTAPPFRRDIFLRAADILERRATELAEYMMIETGSNAFWAEQFNLPLAAEIIRDMAGRSNQLGGEIPLLDNANTSALVWREPYGVILGIAPWNAPYILGVRACATAIMAGNTVVLKASEIAPRCSWAIGSVFRDAGLPPGVLNVFCHASKDAAVVTQALISHPSVKKINFTGSTAVGRIIAREAGQHLKPVLLELGGKASAIVMGDANLREAAKNCIMGALLHGGQICMSTERILVHKSITGQFKEALNSAFHEFIGSGTKCPILINTASANKSKTLVDNALSHGASILAIGHTDDNHVLSTQVPPTILQDVNPKSEIYYTESFGPTVTLFTFNSEDEAIKLANDTEYGLTAAVFTQNLGTGLRMAKRIETGAVHINGMTVHDEPALPHGGVKNSGFGRFGANGGLGEFLKSKSVTFRL